MSKNIKFAKTKYFTEISYQTHVLTPYLIRPTDLYLLKSNSDQEIVKKLEECNIYFICKRPKIITNSKSVTFDDKKVTFSFSILKNGESIPLVFEYPRNPGQFPEWAVHFQISPDYPHDHFELYNENKNIFHKIPFSQMIQTGIQHMAGEHTDYLLNQEVLYIGQSYSKKKKRNITDRLKNHSTLQKIISELSSTNPDFEAVIYLFEYNPYNLLLKFNGISGGHIDGGEDVEHRKRALEYRMNDAREVSLNEASLIKYFEPRYNVIYKKEYPSTNYEVLKDCYNLDFFSVIVEVQAEFFGVQFCSKKIQPIPHHVAEFRLHDPKVRKNFFEV